VRACILHDSIALVTACVHGWCESPIVLSGKKFDEIVWEHSIKEVTNEHNRLGNLLEACIVLPGDVFLLQSAYTTADIELIIRHLCRLD